VGRYWAQLAARLSCQVITNCRSNRGEHTAQDVGFDGRRNLITSCPAGQTPRHLAWSVAASEECVRPPTYPSSRARFFHTGPCPSRTPTMAWATSCRRTWCTSSSSARAARYRDTVMRLLAWSHCPKRVFAWSKPKLHDESRCSRISASAHTVTRSSSATGPG